MKMNTRSQAINEKCKDCSYDSYDSGTWREQVEACIDEKCALWDFRPLTSQTLKNLRQERYDNMTTEEKAKADAKALQTKERFEKSRQL